MREYKYRVYRKGTNEYLYLTLNELIENGYSTDDIRGEHTGLKDKNNKEIYEGDIIKQGLGEIFWDSKIAQFRVKWHDKTWLGIRGEFEEYRNEGSEPLFTNSYIAWEVIGNIYENPKLLEEK